MPAIAVVQSKNYRLIQHYRGQARSYGANIRCTIARCQRWGEIFYLQTVLDIRLATSAQPISSTQTNTIGQERQRR